MSGDPDGQVYSILASGSGARGTAAETGKQLDVIAFLSMRPRHEVETYVMNCAGFLNLSLSDAADHVLSSLIWTGSYHIPLDDVGCIRFEAYSDMVLMMPMECPIA